MMKIEIMVEKTNTEFSVYTKNYVVFTIVNSIVEFNKNFLEALQLFFEKEIL